MAAGFALLIFGAQGLVKGSSSLAIRHGIPPLFVGLTIVAIGTSTPELVVSIGSALQDKGDVSVGNVVGSNIFNIAAILGITALITPIRISLSTIKFDIPIMIAVSILAALLFRSGELGRGSGIILVTSLLIYFAATFYFIGKTAPPKRAAAKKKAPKKEGFLLLTDLLFILGGVLLLILGGRLVVATATNIALAMGVSHAVIGLTIVGMGTSFPELVTSIVAASRKQPDMAIGNVVGSNIFNMLGVLGLSSLLTPLSAPGVSFIDWNVMVVFAMLLLPLAWTDKTLDRKEGMFFLMGYGLYIWWLWFSS